MYLATDLPEDERCERFTSHQRSAGCGRTLPTLRPPMIKRLFDVVASASALLVLAPILLAIAFAVKVESKGPVFFRQWRVGRDQKLFRVFKFRTMIAGAA